MSILKFNTFEEYNAAKALPLKTIVIGYPIPEYNSDGTLTGSFLCDCDLNKAQLDELETHGIAPYQAPIEG